MGKRDCKYQIVYRDEALSILFPGVVFFNAQKSTVGGIG
uniref:Uncharacterized protein n=1 Tax=Klebsiella pneumoniae TaxID=573 RepID=A0A486PCT0_KLEPN|nr:Uncharacterised protein [Klebsiella pneumoniae]